jgi:hypothetical protein
MKGWYRECHRHSLAARGIRTSFNRKRSRYDFAVLGFIVAEKKDARSIPLESFRRYVEQRNDDELIDILRNKELNEAMRSVLLSEVRKRGLPEHSLNLAGKGKDNWRHIDLAVNPEKAKRIAEIEKQMGSDMSEEEFSKLVIEYERLKAEEENQNMAAKRIFKKGKYHSTLSGSEVKRLAEKVKSRLQPFASKIQIAGSIRRKKSDPVDIDIVMIPKDKEKIRMKLSDLGRITKSGGKMIETKIKRVDTDVYFADEDDFGAQLMTYTGPSGANIYHRGQAKAKGWKLNQYGIFDKSGRRIASSERDIYKKLGSSYRIPEMRGKVR